MNAMISASGGTFGCGDVIEIIPVGSESVIRIEMFGDEMNASRDRPRTGEVLEQHGSHHLPSFTITQRRS